jgi:hypothetical protein
VKLLALKVTGLVFRLLDRRSLQFQFRFRKRAYATYCSAFLAGSLVVVCSNFAPAQTTGATIYGVVCGGVKPLPEARVRLVPQGHGQVGERRPTREAHTDANGHFSFLRVQWGSYTLVAVAQGWHQQSVRLDLRSNATTQVVANLAASTKPRALDEDVWWGVEFGNLSIEKLPNARNIWAILEHQEPSAVVNRVDIDGLETGVPALFSALGSSWTESEYLLNAFNVTDPYTTGLPNIAPDVDALSEFQVVTGAKPADFSGSGMDVALANPRGGDELHGAARLFYSPSWLQSDNFNSRLRNFNFPGPERLKYLIDGSAQLGGTLLPHSGKFPFFTSFSTQQLSKTVGGFAAPIDVGVYRGMVDISPIKTESHELSVLYSGQHLTNSHEFFSSTSASPLMATPAAPNEESASVLSGIPYLTAPSATTRQDDSFHQFQVQWDQNIGRASVFSVGFGVSHAIIDSALQSGISGISTIDLATLAQSGPAPLALAGTRTRYEARVMAQTIVRNAAGTHNLSVGLNWDRSDIANNWDSLGGMQQVLLNGVGAEVIRWNTPAHSRDYVQEFAEYIQDAWRPTKWLALPIGLRVDTWTGQAAGVAQGISWTTLEPRLGFVLPVARTGLVLRASWSRYGHVLQGRYLDFGDPNAIGGQVFRWTDVNGDGVAQPQEIGQLLERFGGPYSAVNPGLLQPYTDELSFGGEKNLGAGFTIQARFFRRDDHRLIAIDNIGVPFSDYTTQQVLDPGDDGIFGTADDQTLTLYDRFPSALGQDFLILANRYHAHYKGFEVRVTQRLGSKWAFSGSFTAGENRANSSTGNQPFQNDAASLWTLAFDPNTLINDPSRTAFDHSYSGKTAAYYAAPRRFQLALVASYFDGYPFGRLLLVNGFNQGPFYVRATPVNHPGGFQTEMNTTVDVRLARDFPLSRGAITAYLDVFNLLNVNSNTRELDLTGPTFYERVPVSVEAPRTARLGVQWKF